MDGNVQISLPVAFVRYHRRVAIVPRLVFRQRDIANRFEQPPVIEPIDPVERREFCEGERPRMNVMLTPERL